MLTIEEVRAVPLFSSLSESELERLVRTSADITLRPGEFAVHEGGERALFAVLSGKLEVVKQFDGVERTLGWRLPGTIFGEVPLAFATPFPGAYRAAEPSRVMRVEPHQYFAVAAAAPEVAEKLGALARERIGGLQGVAAQAPKAQVAVCGDRWDPACGTLRRFLSRNQIAHDWLLPEAPSAGGAWRGELPAAAERPAVRLADGDAAVPADPAHARGTARPADPAAPGGVRRGRDRRRTGRARRGGVRRLRGPAHAGDRARGAGRPGRHVVADRELPRLSERRLRRRAGEPGAAAGAPPRRRDPGHAHRRPGRSARPARSSSTATRACGRRA